jgi:hypothetical protein
LWILEEIDSCRQTSDCHAGVAQPKLNVGKNWARDVVQRTLKKLMFGRRYQPKPERKNGIRNRGLRQQLQSKREFTIYRKTTGLETAKQIARSSVGLQTIRNWMLWRVQPAPKWKKNLLAALA